MALNPQQRQAVEAGSGPVLIIAGPGTGKTKTLTERIAHLLSSGVEASRILALTFTIKAAREMSERVSVLLDGGQAPTISTFHSLGHRILKDLEPKQKLDFVSDSDRLALIRELPRPLELKSLTTREVALKLSRAKGSTQIDPDSPMHMLLGRYQKALLARGQIDYDDLLFRTYQGLLAQIGKREAWQRRYDYILIDEFQDTSQVQWELIRAIAGGDNVFVIGDPKQSIYGFRGASAAMFDRFRADYPNYTEIALAINYRSDKAIVGLASAIFGGREALVAHSSQPGGTRVVSTLNEFSEADYVLARIEEGIGGSDLLKAGESKGCSFRDFAVVYRTHQVARKLQQRLHDSGIPYQVVGEGSPYEQPDVQAVINTLRWLVGGELPRIKGFTPGQLQVLLAGLPIDGSVSALAEAIIETLQLDGQKLNQLVGTLIRFSTVQACLDYIDSISQGEFYDPHADAVTLLTIHASKGLEFPHVLLIAAEEGTLPSIRKTASTDFDEEKRLFYVAVTRAQHQLDIVWARTRAGEARQPSRFIEQIAPEILPRHDDPRLPELHKRLRRREQKARQGRLF